MLNQNYTKYKTDQERLNKEKEIFNYQKDMYFQLNYFLSTGKTINNVNINEDKVNEINNKLQINNLALPVPSVGTINNKFNNKNPKIKKEILVEKPKNILFSERSTKKEKQSNKDDKINRSGSDIYNKNNDKTNISLYSGSSSNLTNAIDNYFSGTSVLYFLF